MRWLRILSAVQLGPRSRKSQATVSEGRGISKRPAEYRVHRGVVRGRPGMTRSFASADRCVDSGLRAHPIAANAPSAARSIGRTARQAPTLQRLARDANGFLR